MGLGGRFYQAVRRIGLIGFPALQSRALTTLWASAMIGILLVAHGDLGNSLIDCAVYVLGQRPPLLESCNINAYTDIDTMLEGARDKIAQLDQGDGVLVMADVYGATPCNTICRLLDNPRVEVVAGANVPMLLKVLTYRHSDLKTLAERAATGARDGAFRVPRKSSTHDATDA